MLHCQAESDAHCEPHDNREDHNYRDAPAWRGARTLNQRQLRMSLDRRDFGILSLLQNNASLSNKQIAAAVGLAPSSAHERLKRLRDEGVLRGTHADVDPRAMASGSRPCSSSNSPSTSGPWWTTLWPVSLTYPRCGQRS